LFFLIKTFILFHLFVQPKKKVKNKVNIEASTCEAFIVEEISTFISYYFEPHLKTRINHIPRRDDIGEVP